MLRIIITSLLGLLILFGAYKLATNLAASRNIPKPIENKIITPVSALLVKNRTTPISLKTSGNLVAKNQIEIFSEVSGIFESSAHLFKSGSRFQKGETLLNINGDELRSNLRAQKSNLINQITLFLADLKFDYPDAFPNWEAYVRNVDINRALDKFPEPTSEKERLFILSKGINTLYYNIENLQKRLGKHVITAPYNGVLTEVMINPGALIRNGQKIANFISTSSYEMVANINVSYMDLLKIGKQVELHNLERTKSWKGRIARLNGIVDQATQTIEVYIQVSGSGLREGLYLEADLEVKALANTYELDRKLLFDQNKLFIIQDTILEPIVVKPLFYNESTVIVEGLPEGTQILGKPVPGSHAGMRVAITEF